MVASVLDFKKIAFYRTGRMWIYLEIFLMQKVASKLSYISEKKTRITVFPLLSPPRAY